ncbi:uncharacterized protein FOMMEDRAFT_30794 [Fomitiporia mediterranea MF3/22]|uniref:uncharacterized protein n=1 Tax=Fomitiporia mediterranea (strain MF3/22) TaxID=694068 RepID=UPI0004407FDC|nr:uncharacterized protein FOMMEDRAFT_30794 [Fomitiporia mediterranea MF3/22]EJD00133.1 hypothetical protein FOMMEDRAFT_30794 [Fomitiporia mediterranea MF3/22]
MDDAGMIDSTSPDPAEASPPQSAYTPTSSVVAHVAEFEAEVDELMQCVREKAELLNGWQDTHDLEVEQLSQRIFAVWSSIGDLQSEFANMKNEFKDLLQRESRDMEVFKDTLQKESKDMMKRIEEIGAAITGDIDAEQSIKRRTELNKRRDEMVKILTGNDSPTWDDYVNAMAEGCAPHEVRRTLYEAAKDMIAIYEAKVQMPEPVRSESAWMIIVKGKAKEDKQERTRMEVEYEERLKQAREAQHILDLLRDEEVLESLLM